MTQTLFGMTWMHCITPLHHGAGQGLGYIDRPLLREATTGFPYVQGSTVKGMLRAQAKECGSFSAKVDEWFGKEPDKSQVEGGQGRLCFHDLQLLLLPVSSLAGIFAWTTCPFVLRRLYRWLPQLKALGPKSLKDVVEKVCQLEVPSKKIAPNNGCLDCNGFYQLGELSLEKCGGQGWQKDVAELADGLALALFPEDPQSKQFFTSRFALLSDEDFALLSKRATQVEANIKINEWGVTEQGSLRYTESLPIETVMATMFSWDSQKNDCEAKQVNDFIRSQPIIQLGGDETKGKGIVRSLLISPLPFTGGASPDAMNCSAAATTVDKE